MTVVIDENIILVKGHRWGPERFEGNSYSFQASVCDIVCVKVVKAFGHVQQLERITFSAKYDYQGRLTRLIRFAPGFFLKNSSKVPFGIHFKTICKGFVVTPMKGTMFGCLSLFHVMASSKNDCRTHRYT